MIGDRGILSTYIYGENISRYIEGEFVGGNRDRRNEICISRGFLNRAEKKVWERK